MIDDATRAQIRAADPRQSTWLSANAGSGKTRVLTDRVARLLLDGTDPSRILCLTYTKAAAAEMQIRLFDTLGSWAMLADDALTRRLGDLGVDLRGAPDLLDNARRLFARAIETPGGLRIQTIHSFCASLLRRFPLEAGVSPQFTEMDDRATDLMLQEIVSEMAESEAEEQVQALAKIYSGEDFGALLRSLVTERQAFSGKADRREWLRHFGLSDNFNDSALLAEVFLGTEADLLARCHPFLMAGTPSTDQKFLRDTARFDWAQPNLELLRALEKAFIYSSEAANPLAAKLDRFPTSATRKALGALLEPFQDLMKRVESARERRLALEAAENSLALHRFAQPFLQEYARRKDARALLDFDDLIDRAEQLLTNSSVAQWVLFRLDGGIDHILVDEAQDTAPRQWRVIELLTREFTAGEGARAVARTIFVVGDKKQSIYSFQGADLDAFDRMQQHFSARFAEIERPIQSLELEYSFRSSPAVLDIVDQVFAPHLTMGLGGRCEHLAFRSDMPGRVELWPLIETASATDNSDWWNPVDLISEEHHDAQLATGIAQHIRQMLAEGTPIPTKEGFRAAHAGDFLILVRRRSDLFAEIIRACKKAGLPIAGADRLKLGGELAVKDLAAVLSILATPEDDLSFAAALRSPLFGWTEDAVFRLAQGRQGFISKALREQAEDFPDTVAILDDLRSQADFLRPYDLIERILTRHDGRRKLIGRLGPEAEDGIDELLSQALAYERNDVPSLTGFLTWLQTDDVTVKRQMDNFGAQIRVMTVHGAKGLEAPIVLLPDTADPHNRERGHTIRLSNEAVAWKTAKDQSPAAITSARQERDERAEHESLRLLYVALTRAQSRLIVAGAGKASKPLTWYNLVVAGMTARGAITLPDGRLVYETGAFPAVAQTPAPDDNQDEVLPNWAIQRAPVADHPPKPLSPSDLGGAKALPGDHGDETEDAKRRGTRLHLLLEHLPKVDPARWPDLAQRLLEEGDDLADLLAEASGVIQSPPLAPLFADATLAEVPVTAELNGQRLHGTIDRLIIGDDTVLAVDFKSNRVVPESADQVPEGIRRQLAAYREALRQIYPDRQIDTAVLWTRTAVLMQVN